MIHGYASDASVWETWEELLGKNNNIIAQAVTFNDDPTTDVD
ncbi:MAG: hypothetical protein ACJ71F_15210 [Nitrososphaeraceae archaeon]